MHMASVALPTDLYCFDLCVEKRCQPMTKVADPSQFTVSTSDIAADLKLQYLLSYDLYTIDMTTGNRQERT